MKSDNLMIWHPVTSFAALFSVPVCLQQQLCSWYIHPEPSLSWQLILPFLISSLVAEASAIFPEFLRSGPTAVDLKKWQRKWNKPTIPEKRTRFSAWAAIIQQPPTSQRPVEASEVQKGDLGSDDSAETQTRCRMFQALLQASCSKDLELNHYLFHINTFKRATFFSC